MVERVGRDGNILDIEKDRNGQNRGEGCESGDARCLEIKKWTKGNLKS